MLDLARIMLDWHQWSAAPAESRMVASRVAVLGIFEHFVANKVNKSNRQNW